MAKRNLMIAFWMIWMISNTKQCFFNLIRANHHLEKVQRGPAELPPPKFLKQVKTWLSQTINPAVPNENIALMLKGNAENWLQTALQALTEHYSNVIVELKSTMAPFLAGDWEGAWLIAVKWIKKRFPLVSSSNLHWRI